jgi:hypothetical protein
MGRMCRTLSSFGAMFAVMACSDRGPAQGSGASGGTTPPVQVASRWVATPNSVGPIAAGSLYSVVAQAFRAAPRPSPQDVEEQACDYVQLPGLPPGVSLMVFGDTIVRIDIDTTGVITREGVGVGSAESALLSQYRGRVRVEPHPYSGPEWHYVVVTPSGDSTFRMTFETDGKVVRTYRVGLRRAVDLIEGCS